MQVTTKKFEYLFVSCKLQQKNLKKSHFELFK